jgi:uncharacterized repeat protein (TIGR02543 family)
MSQAQSVTAAIAGAYALNVTPSGTGSGTVTGGAINCATGSTAGCGASITNTTPYATITLTASPNVGSRFIGWSGGCTGSSTTCNVTMTQSKAVYATFSSP